MSYGVPSFYLHGNLLLYAGFKNHIGLYPCPETIIAFKRKLTKYQISKGTIKIAHNQEFPYDLLKGIVMYGVEKVEVKKGE